MAQNSSLSTTFTISSTDMTSDSLSFTVSETLSLTGSGGIKRINIPTKYTGSAATAAHPLQYQNVGDFSTDKKTGLELYGGSGSQNALFPQGITGSQSHTPTYLYLKNITGSGFSGSSTTAGTTNTVTTSSNVHLFMSASGMGGPGISGSYDVAVLKQGNFLYMPINPNSSYYVYAPTGSVAACAGYTGTLIEYAIFR